MGVNTALHESMWWNSFCVDKQFSTDAVTATVLLMFGLEQLVGVHLVTLIPDLDRTRKVLRAQTQQETYKVSLLGVFCLACLASVHTPL